MDWSKSIPAVLLIALTVPAAKAKCLAPSEPPAKSLSHRPVQKTVRRRDEHEMSAELVGLAGEYLKSHADGIVPSAVACQAWEQFYPLCDGAIRRFASRFRSRGIDPDDCVQEVWAELMQSLPNFKVDESRGRFSSWLYTVVRSKSTDMTRRQMRRPSVSLNSALEADLSSDDSNPAEQIERQSDREVVGQAMATLRDQTSEQSYQVMHLRYMQGLDAQETADALGMTREQVWVREHRMKKKLQQILSPMQGSTV